eukprot:4651640-Prymnesium_polylepis.1
MLCEGSRRVCRPGIARRAASALRDTSECFTTNSSAGGSIHPFPLSRMSYKDHNIAGPWLADSPTGYCGCPR